MHRNIWYSLGRHTSAKLHFFNENNKEQNRSKIQGDNLEAFLRKAISEFSSNFNEIIDQQHS